jgi:hypothetical protein
MAETVQPSVRGPASGRVLSEAELVQLPSDDQHRLTIARQLLSWSSRYAAPKKDEQAEKAWA